MPDKIIFDTTVISNYLLSDAGSVISNYYKTRGIITREVYDELAAGRRTTPVLQNIDHCIGLRKFELISLSKKEHEFYISLLDSLGKGEASCIAFAKYSGGVVATDDKAVRRICDSFKIPVTGTIGILVMLCREGHTSIDSADALLSKMIHNGFYSPVRRISELFTIK